MSLRHLLAAIAMLSGMASATDPPKLLRSLSGPSGKTIGSEYVLTETRSRFVYPTDSSLVVYFEWVAQPGNHILTAVWKRPDGSIASISPDVNIQTSTSTLQCYWIFSLSPGVVNGVWAVDVRVDGQPAGSHPFELAGFDSQQLSVDGIFKTIGPSVVWVRKLDQAGKTTDLSMGFVWSKDAIATAFQAIDSAALLEVEFTDGRRVKTNEVLAFSRTGDWAIVRAETGTLLPIRRGDNSKILVGQRLLLFNWDSNARVIGVVDIGGEGITPGFGRRIHVTPEAPLEAAGSPLLDSFGHVVGIAGGSVRPGARIDRAASMGNRDVREILAHGAGGSVINSATPVSEVPLEFPASPVNLAQLASEGLLTPALEPMPELIYGGTTSALRKRVSSGLPIESEQFSSQDNEIGVFTQWIKKGKISKGAVSVVVFDASNHLRATGPAKKVALGREPQQVSFTFPRGPLPPGTYRVDISWDGHPVWRTFFVITD
jgi:hypothetical protein